MVLFAALFLQMALTLFPYSVCYMMYLNHVNWPPKSVIDFTNLTIYGLEGENFYIHANDVRLGTWLIQPVKSEMDVSFAHRDPKDMPIILYLHGNAGTRVTYNRVELYRNLQRLGFTVVAFDYRGYGDSTGQPWGEQDLVADSFAVYQWIRETYPQKEVFVWGHSLGTGVSTHLVHYIEKKGITVDGLILDSPFSSLDDAMRRHPLLYFFHLVPGFTDTVAKAMREMQASFLHHLGRWQVNRIVFPSSAHLQPITAKRCATRTNDVARFVYPCPVLRSHLVDLCFAFRLT